MLLSGISADAYPEKGPFEKRCIFQRIALVCFFLVPFVGKRKFFYGNSFEQAYYYALSSQGLGRIAAYPWKALEVLAKLFFEWGNFCVEQPWICWIYLAGVLLTFLLLQKQRRTAKKMVSKMAPYERWEEPLKNGFGKYSLSHVFSFAPLGAVQVCISELDVTPFSTGLLHPKIILPKVVLEHCTMDEIDLMILHEKIHIRLGHLWNYFLWDLLRSLFWPNPFLTICMKYLQEDLEDVCDRVTIRQSKMQPWEYGKLLLKTVRLMQREPMASTMAFAGERGYGEFKRRIQKILEFRPYKRSRAICLHGMWLLVLLAMFLGIKDNSYSKYVDMDALLSEHGIKGRAFYLGFGGYMKLPGMGGGGCVVYVDYENGNDNLIIPYQEQKDILVKILKIL